MGLAGLSRAIDRLGPSYVKLGQFLSTRPDIVGGKVAVELERLQDRVAPMSRETAVAIIEASFGTKIESQFESFGEPVAAASIAQVHRAEVKTDEGMRPVAVKVLRAGIERRFARDLADMLFAATLRGELGAGVSPLAADPGCRDPRPLGAHGDGFPARSRGGVGIRRKFQQ